MNQVQPGLWRRILAIARPFWFSNGKSSAVGMLSLLAMLGTAFYGMYWFIDAVGGILQQAAGFGTSDWLDLVKHYSLPVGAAVAGIWYVLVTP